MRRGLRPKNDVEGWRRDTIEHMSLTLETLPTATNEIVIFDTEYTTWEGSRERGWSKPDEHRELVQIAAVRVSLATGVVTEEFSEFVRPRINSQLSGFFTALTVITQAEIDASGKDFAAVYTDFRSWVDTVPVYSYGSSKASDGEILAENIALYELDLPYNDEQYHNLRPVFADAGIAVERYSSGELYQAFGLALSGQVHNAMHDVRSLTQSLLALKAQLKSDT